MKFEHVTCRYCKTSYRKEEKACWNCGTKQGQNQPKSLPVIGKLKKNKKP